MSNNNIKSDLLGMPFGTATNKLRKMLLYECVKLLGADTCYRCGEKIESIAEFSIEHTVSWRYSDNPLETFFDLSKIAYSHLICNVSQGKSNPVTGIHPNKGKPNLSKKRVQQDGTLWCSKGKHFTDVNNFGKDKWNWAGYKAECKMCRSTYRKERYKLHLSR